MASDPTASEIAGVEPAIEPGAEAGPGLPLPEAAEARPSPQERLRRMLAAAGEHEAAGRLDGAEALLEQIFAAVPEQPQALHLSGIVAFRRGRRAEAVRRVEQAITRAPNIALFRRNLCEMYRKSDRLDDALQAGGMAVQLDPADKFALHNLNVLHYQRLELDAAIACAEKALAIDPQMPGAHIGIAEAALARGDFARQRRLYRRQRQRAGQFPERQRQSHRRQRQRSNLGR
jgi:tetratricopeptide (TPR) repeat protein